MSETVTFEKRGPVGVLTVDNPPVNALSQSVRQGLADGIAEANRDDQVQAVVLVCKGRTFIAGADIREFGKPMAGPALPDVIDNLERSDKPVVAAIHGTAFGGGLEVALGCHFRVAVPGAQIGLPEVKLGLLPGAGGTQRLPRLIGVKPALEMIVTGDPVDARKAEELGAIDEIVQGDLAEAALAFAKRVIDEKRPLRRVREMQQHIDAAKREPNLFDDFHKSVARKIRGFEAPVRCIQAVKGAVELPFEQGLKQERELFTQCMASPQSAAQRYVFFAERQANKIPDVPKDTPTLDVGRVGIVGAGTMGGGIAMALANAGVNVVLLDREREFVDKGIDTIKKNYASSVNRGRITQAQRDERVARITPSTSYDDFKDADLVVEAVFEEMPIKKEVFQDLDRVCRPDAIMATNTSTLDVNEIASATSRPEQVIGLHFFSPANVMKLLEIVRGDETSKSVIATAMKLAKQIDKIGVLVGVCHGFVGNRMLYQYRREASFLLEEGASPQQVDKVITDFGLPMGPFQMADLAGLDIGWRVRKAQGKPQGERYSGYVADALCERGRFGQKTGKGYYKYEGRTPVPDPEVDELILQVAKEQGIERRRIDDEEILKRCLLPMVNEGAKILEEGIALRASDIDMVWINGYGFPAYRGGPMYWADTQGLDRVLGDIKSYQKAHGDIWKPAPLLEKLAAEGQKFTG